MFISERAGRCGASLAISVALASIFAASQLLAADPLEHADTIGLEQDNCPILESSDWTAWVNRLPGPEDPSLIVAGRIQLPTPGYTVEARLGPSSRFEPATQIVVLDLSEPNGVVAQVLVTEDIQFSFPAWASDYRSVIVVCASAILGAILDIDGAH